MSTPPTTARRTAFTLRAWCAVGGLLLFVALVRAFYALSYREPPRSFETLTWLGSGLLFAHLVAKDRVMVRGTSGPMDLGLFVLIAWPLAVPYHFLASEGRRAWRPILLFLVTYFGAYAIALLVFVAARALIYGAAP